MKLIISGPDFEDINYNEIINFVKKFNFETQKEEDFLLKFSQYDFLPEKFAKIRVLDPYKKELNEEPFELEIEYERSNLKRKNRKRGIIYSGNHFIKILKELLKERLDLKKEWVIYFSDQLLSTFEDRWHIRVIIFGIPVVISVPGIVYGPARDREYYLAREMGFNLNCDYIKEKDERKTDVLKGYILQVIYFYKCLYENKEFRFCEDENCSIYNSHWQREVLNAQLKQNLCEKHLKEFFK
ncbi:MAG: DUF6775 family putative metallopeptidase [candidate division WOR-3 bacterium]